MEPPTAELQQVFKKRQTFKKATLKAELTFDYEVKKSFVYKSCLLGGLIYVKFSMASPQITKK